MSNVANTLNERGNRYGAFGGHAEISQKLQRIMHGTSNWHKLSLDKREALQMIQHKVARILNGDPEYRDNWHDIQGYAKLAEDLCCIPPVPSPSAAMNLDEPGMAAPGSV